MSLDVPLNHWYLTYHDYSLNISIKYTFLLNSKPPFASFLISIEPDRFHSRTKRLPNKKPRARSGNLPSKFFVRITLMTPKERKNTHELAVSH